MWTSVFFQAPCNFMAPFLIYLFLSKRTLVMQQSVIDELEFLDIEAGVKKGASDDDDDFDYVYHLPYADMSRLGARRDPFAKEEEPKKDARYVSTSGLSVASGKSGISMRSISKRQVRAMLGANQNAGYNNLVASKMQGSHVSLNAPGDFNASSRRGSTASSYMPPGGLGAGLGVPGARHTRRPSAVGLIDGTMVPQRERRASAFAPNLGKIVPYNEEANTTVNLLLGEDEEEKEGWRALPKWWTDKIPNRITAFISLILMIILTVFVFVYDVINHE